MRAVAARGRAPPHPNKHPETIAALAPKEEQVAAIRIGPDHLLRLGRQSVEAVPQIDRLAGEKDLGAGRQADHTMPFIARAPAPTPPRSPSHRHGPARRTAAGALGRSGNWLTYCNQWC